MVQQSLFQIDAFETKKPIILLDLNFTLVANSKDKDGQRCSYADKIRMEYYRQWLVELVKPFTVLLCTVRNQLHRDLTMQHIAELTGWQPEVAYFNPTSDFRGFLVKDRYLRESIFPKYGTPDVQPYFGIESSIGTRAMYARHRIPAKPVVDGVIWQRLPFQG